MLFLVVYSAVFRSRFVSGNNRRHSAEQHVMDGRRKRGRKRCLGSEESEDDPFPYYDVCTEAKTERLIAMSKPEEHPRAEKPKNSIDATFKLALFRPAHEGVSALRDLLEARADPNIVAGLGELTQGRASEEPWGPGPNSVWPDQCLLTSWF